MLGNIVTGRVIKLMPFGAFIKIDGSDLIGLVKIPEISNERIRHPADVLTIDQVVKAIVLATNQNGQVILSIKRIKH